MPTWINISLIILAIICLGLSIWHGLKAEKLLKQAKELRKEMHDGPP